jgi:hypothetical protein
VPVCGGGFLGMNEVTMTRERRNLSFLGRKRRREFERSIQRLRGLGLPNWAVQCYRRAARIAGQLPHEVVCRVAESAANQMLGANPDAELPESFRMARLVRHTGGTGEAESPESARKRLRTH